MPVTLSVPVPASATLQNISYFPISGGLAQAPIKPTSVSGGMATFQVPHFDDGTVTSDLSPSDPGAQGLVSIGSSWDTSAGGDPSSTVNWTPPNSTTPQPLLEGDQLGIGATVSTPVGFNASFALPDGSSLTMAPGTVITVNQPVDGLTPTLTLDSGFVHQVDAPRPSTAPPRPYKSLLHIRTYHANGMGSRGTAFSAGLLTCGQTGHHALKLSVSDGVVDLLSQDQVVQSVTAGQEISSCVDCAAGDLTSCSNAIAATDFCERLYKVDQVIENGCLRIQTDRPLTLGVHDCQNISAGLSAGRIIYDPTLAQPCLDAISSSTCQWWGNHLDEEVPACAGALRGQVAQGGACIDDYDCTSFNCGMNATCPGTCAARVSLPQSSLTLSQVCDPNNDTCTLGLYCDPANSRCRRYTAEGSACTVGNYECPPSLYCSAAHVCVVGTAPASAQCGDTPGSETVSCSPGLHCTSRTGGVCVARKESGACKSRAECVSLNCLNGQCAPLCAAP